MAGGVEDLIAAGVPVAFSTLRLRHRRFRRDAWGQCNPEEKRSDGGLQQCEEEVHGLVAVLCEFGDYDAADGDAADFADLSDREESGLVPGGRSGASGVVASCVHACC